MQWEGVWDYRLPDYRTGPFTDCLGNDTATYRKHAEGRSFLKFKPLKFSLYRLIEFKFKDFFDVSCIAYSKPVVPIQ